MSAMCVDFMIIGAQKSGTTSLAAQLASHPQICFSSIKEPEFFDSTEDWEENLAAYHQLFEPANGRLCGEASTTYTFLPETPQTSVRIHSYNPRMKLIYIMRQPVDRIISHYAHNLIRGLEDRTPFAAVAEDPRYINRSRYGVQIQPYAQLFGRENILLLVFEEYVADQLGTLAEVAEFLGINEAGFSDVDTAARHKSVGEPQIKFRSAETFARSAFFKSMRDVIPEGVRHTVRHRLLSNQLNERPRFDQDLKELIWRFVASDVAEVEELMGRSLPLWREALMV